MHLTDYNYAFLNKSLFSQFTLIFCNNTLRNKFSLYKNLTIFTTNKQTFLIIASVIEKNRSNIPIGILVWPMMQISYYDVFESSHCPLTALQRTVREYVFQTVYLKRCLGHIPYYLYNFYNLKFQQQAFCASY